MSLAEKMQQVNTRQDFVEFVQSLRQDFAQHTNEWQNHDIDAYLDALAAWAEDYYQLSDVQEPENADWRFISLLLYTGKIYE